MRFLPAGDTAILVELRDLDEVAALHGSLKADPVAGVDAMIPAAQTLLLGFDPAQTGAAELAAMLAARDAGQGVSGTRRVVEVPVVYDGQDLDEVAALTGLGRDEVVARHQQTSWRAGFNGFAPGFCYLTGGDPALEVPRRKTPRTAIPAGSVALAGRFSGVYPQSSPGGWQIIGTTPVAMWDLDRDPPALIAPGDEVRFVAADAAVADGQGCAPEAAQKAAPPEMGEIEVLAAPFPASFQDAGRMGMLDQGIPASGAMDRAAFRALNRLLGNAPGTAALEVTGGGLRLRSDAACTVAVTGAARRVTVNGQDFASHRPVALDSGDELLLGPPESGTYGYLGLRGGFDVTPVLGSASTDTLARIGPDMVTAGSRLRLAKARAGAVGDPLPAPALPRAGDVVTVEVTLGPRADWFTDQAVDSFLRQHWRVSQQSSRVGKRLEGQGLERRDDRELPSEGTPHGAIQVPHSGQPVLFLSDHPLTGGYPVIAVVSASALDLVAQAPPGALLRFHARKAFHEITPSKGR
ncbi:5-oxoprolinase/urea amidolyase family protein [Paracoccus aurantiacus]|uniref:5-oxoprolinase subunit B/C family protein n=1 Tax=Paracoccus aurantiacus TaxID=2599412 RepID=UPI00363FAA5D